MIEHGEGLPISAEASDAVKYTDACILCRRSFASRAAWACHASKLHGYRLASSVLAGSDGSTLCKACGKCFSKPARLRRHLLHSGDCRRRWGAFTLPAGAATPEVHDCLPPPTLEGLLEQRQEEHDPAVINKGLLEALETLEEPDADGVWELVADFVEPLAVFRETLRVWSQHPGRGDGVEGVAQDVTLMLDPELIGDTFCRPKQPAAPSVCCSDLPGPIDSSFPFVLSGQECFFDLGSPPCPAFCYPFIGGAPLALAKRQAGFVEEAGDVVSRMVQQSLSSRVLLRASRETLASIEPVTTWLLSVGFVLTSEGLGSPVF